MNNLKKINKSVIVADILIAIAVACGCALYMRDRSVVEKGLTSFGFVLLGLVNLIHEIVKKNKNTKFKIFVFIALSLSLIADVVIDFNFIYGAIIFASAHIFYYVAQLFIKKIKGMDFIPSAILLAIALCYLFLFPGMNISEPDKLVICVAYSLIISVMAGKAIAHAISLKRLFTIVFAIGSILFYISDMMLVMHIFSDVWEYAINLCHLTYYPGQCLLAMSILLSGIESKKDKSE